MFWFTSLVGTLPASQRLVCLTLFWCFCEDAVPLSEFPEMQARASPVSFRPCVEAAVEVPTGAGLQGGGWVSPA